jgi:peptidoglycan/LPS O-acetylase OafA/YrhL
MDVVVRDRIVLVSVVLGSVSAVVVLWLTVGGNAAGWATFILLPLASGIVVGATDLDLHFLRLRKPVQTVVVAATVALALAGGIVYLFLPGTTSWWLLGLPAIPILLMAHWLGEDSARDPSSGGGVSDAPWMAP